MHEDSLLEIIKTTLRHLEAPQELAGDIHRRVVGSMFWVSRNDVPGMQSHIIADIRDGVQLTFDDWTAYRVEWLTR